jgi:hypothetical protein
MIKQAKGNFFHYLDFKSRPPPQIYIFFNFQGGGREGGGGRLRGWSDEDRGRWGGIHFSFQGNSFIFIKILKQN